MDLPRLFGLLHGQIVSSRDDDIDLRPVQAVGGSQNPVVVFQSVGE